MILRWSCWSRHHSNRIAGDTQSTDAVAPAAVVSGYVSDFTAVIPGTGYTSAPAVELALPQRRAAQTAEAAAVMNFGGTVDSVKFRTGLAAKLINISGCPPHPDWIVGTIAYVLDSVPASFNDATPTQDAASQQKLSAD